MKPTKAQTKAVEEYLKGASFRLEAYAGSGKTTTLRLMAEAAPAKRALYLAFNGSVAKEARAKFPRWVEVMTLHSLAFRQTVALNEALRAKFQAREGVVLVRDILETGLVPEDLYGVPAYGVAVATLHTLNAFLASMEEAPTAEMVPRQSLLLVEERHRPSFTQAVASLAKEVWTRMRDPGHPFPLSHDGYVRLWVEAGAPGLSQYEAVLVDEAQDLSPALLRPLLDYHAAGGQLVAVGDSNQAIYGWRGAVDAMKKLPGEALPLPESFRFGEEIADYARYIMELAGRKLDLRGVGGPSEVVEGVGNPPRGAAFIYRTNAGVLEAAAQMAAKGFGVEVVGGVSQVASLVEAGLRLMNGQRVWHPELAYFRSYGEFLRVADLDPSLKALKNLLQRYGTRAGEMVATLQKGRRRVDYTFSTAHRAKGLEWDVVVLGDDFPPEDKATEEEWNLRYVAATRAKRVLDIRNWV